MYFTDAVCPKDDVVGGVNNGWAVAMTLLGFERGEAAATVPIRFQAELDRLIALAQRARAWPTTRSSASGWPGAGRRCRSCATSGMRTLTRFLAGHHPGPDGAISKLYWSEYHRGRHRAGGRHPRCRPRWCPRAGRRRRAFQTDDAGAPNSSASWATTFLNARAGTIYAGTSQIQRNILGEMVLGLPKEPRGEARTWAEQQKLKG